MIAPNAAAIAATTSPSASEDVSHSSTTERSGRKTRQASDAPRGKPVATLHSNARIVAQASYSSEGPYVALAMSAEREVYSDLFIVEIEVFDQGKKHTHELMLPVELVAALPAVATRLLEMCRVQKLLDDGAGERHTQLEDAPRSIGGVVLR